MSSFVRSLLVVVCAAALDACIVVASSGPQPAPAAAAPVVASAEREDHQCGPNFGGASCGPNRCCSMYGWCGGLGEDHCNGARGFGGQYDGPRGVSAERDDHRCGPNYGGAHCGGDRCCSAFDWCGGPTEDHCNGARGYEGQFDGPAAPTASPTYFQGGR